MPFPSPEKINQAYLGDFSTQGTRITKIVHKNPGNCYRCFLNWWTEGLICLRIEVYEICQIIGVNSYIWFFKYYTNKYTLTFWAYLAVHSLAVVSYWVRLNWYSSAWKEDFDWLGEHHAEEIRVMDY